MRTGAAAFLAVALLAAGIGLPVPPSVAASLPYRNGERLTFQVRWIGIPVIKARFSIEGPLPWKNARVFRYQAEVKSIGLLDKLYRVRDSAESLTDAADMFSRRLEIRQSEGSYRSRKQYLFEGGRVTFWRNENPPRYVESPPEALDVLGALYRGRAKLPGPGEESDLTVFASRKIWRVHLRTVRAERLDTLWGSVRALRVEPTLYKKGEKEPFKKGNAWIWVTADAQRVPVRMESRTWLGSVVAHLIETTGIPAGPFSRPPAKKLSGWKPSTRIVKEEAGPLLPHLKEALEKKK